VFGAKELMNFLRHKRLVDFFGQDFCFFLQKKHDVSRVDGLKGDLSPDCPEKRD
jgi:hypothetical protein